MESVQTVVIGAGVVGLAIARALARSGREVVIVEAAERFGTETSARNSEVIHAGIYYPEGSLKALLCVTGRALLIEYARARGIAHRLCGKLIVAQSESEVGALGRIDARARACGVESLQWLSAKEARKREPLLVCEQALWSPGTGVVDSHALMLAFLGDACDGGAVLALKSRVMRGRLLGDGRTEIEVAVDGESDAVRLECQELVNAGGLDAQRLANAIEGFPVDRVPRRYLAKGSYFSLAGRSPFGCLIYPVPDEAGLGTHLTLDLAGQARFGPDVEWVEQIDYAVDGARGDAFYADIRRYWPDLPDGALQPAYSGIRPKIVGPGEAAGDFMILGPEATGVPGHVHLFGIESPGLTSAIAIADRVLQSLGGSN